MGQLGVAIIGCGLIGRKRAESVAPAVVVGFADVMIEKAEALARLHDSAIATSDWRRLVSRQDVNIVIVATTNDALAEVSVFAIKAGKHVLVEKPAARSTRELEVVMGALRESDVSVRVGFNHRYHPSFLKARELFSSGALGDLMFIRARYGHGGRLGYEKEWRARPLLSGGGELIDQGVHLIDLSRWFLGGFDVVSGIARTFYWDMAVEDNAFLSLQTADKKVAFLHCSCTEWKNLFSFEIYSKLAKLHIEGLGGSYGTERLNYYKMRPQMGPPETIIWEYPMIDSSWNAEFADFLQDISTARIPSPTLEDAHAVLCVIEKVYSECGYDYRS